MVQIASVGLGIPQHQIKQQEVKTLVNDLFPNNRKLTKLLPVFDNAMVETRQLVESIDWYKESHTFEEVNNAYVRHAKELSLLAIDDCLYQFNNDISYSDIDGIIFVSSSGIATPSVDAHVLNERNFRDDVTRIPIWGLGCLGGASGLSRGYDYLRAHPEKTIIVVCCELCSLTFQKRDNSMSNLVGTALFGDGASAVLLIGNESPFSSLLIKHKLKIVRTSSYRKRNSLDVMGWNVTNNGFEVVFSKNIPKLIPDFWRTHLLGFLEKEGLRVEDLHTFVAHPGGRKVLEAMEQSIHLKRSMLEDAYDVLKGHGNMSSATVFYVLKRWISKQNNNHNKQALLCALGPGFSSEMMLLELMDA